MNLPMTFNEQVILFLEMKQAGRFRDCEWLWTITAQPELTQFVILDKETRRGRFITMDQFGQIEAEPEVARKAA